MRIEGVSGAHYNAATTEIIIVFKLQMTILTWKLQMTTILKAGIIASLKFPTFQLFSPSKVKKSKKLINNIQFQYGGLFLEI